MLLADSNLFDVARLASFGDILWEHVLWAIDITAEVEIVNLFGVAAIAVTANNQIENGIGRGHDVQIFHHSQELLSGDVLRLRAVKVLESWLQQDTVGHHMLVKG